MINSRNITVKEMSNKRPGVSRNNIKCKSPAVFTSPVQMWHLFGSSGECGVSPISWSPTTCLLRYFNSSSSTPDTSEREGEASEGRGDASEGSGVCASREGGCG